MQTYQQQTYKLRTSSAKYLLPEDTQNWWRISNSLYSQGSCSIHQGCPGFSENRQLGTLLCQNRSWHVQVRNKWSRRAQWNHCGYDSRSAHRTPSPSCCVPLGASHQPTDERSRIPAQWLFDYGIGKLSGGTLTMFSHCVPLPAPGPPSTKTTSGFGMVLK